MIFRKVGGFVYVMSVLVSMEGALADPPVSQWHAGSVWLLYNMFQYINK